MTADDVCAFLALMEKHRVDVWLDGGWAVDAALGRPTRRHSDVDIVIEERDVPAAVSTLQDVGYAPIPRPDTRAWNFVMGDNAGTRSTSTLSSSMSMDAASTARQRTVSFTRQRPLRGPELSAPAQ
jgi:Aminoglycoside-2''-adenylyltransferase